MQENLTPFARLQADTRQIGQEIPERSRKSLPLTPEETENLFTLPLADLLFRAHTVHRQNFPPNEIQVSVLLSVKTGGCPEDCAYCPQSASHETGVEASKLLPVHEVREAALRAKKSGATRFCMGAAWREVKDRDLEALCEILKAVRETGLESCMTLGMLTEKQALLLKEAGLDYYNHNIDTSPDYYTEIITTRSFEDRLNTLSAVRRAGLKVCSGGIVGMGESRRDRAKMLHILASLPEPPESVPINLLIPIKGTPLQDTAGFDKFEFIKTIAVARILMPTSFVRLSAGREGLSDELQAMAFFAGANSVFGGEKLLTATNPTLEKDQKLFRDLGLTRTEGHPEGHFRFIPENMAG